MSENEVFKEENESHVTPERKPNLSPEPVKRQKAKRQRDPSTPTVSDGSTESSTDSDSFDFGDPEDCASYFKSIVGTSLKIDSNTQRCLKTMRKNHQKKTKKKLLKALKAISMKKQKNKPVAKLSFTLVSSSSSFVDVNPS